MKIIFTIILLFLCGEKVLAQPFLPQEMPCYILNQPELTNVFPDGGGIYSIDCIETVGDLDFDPTKDYSLRAGERISFYQNTYILPDDDHQFHAYLDQPNFDVAWYEPLDIGVVPRNEKLELGVQFEDFINDEIENYVNHNPFTDAPNGSLNPFNPEEVDLYAEFWVEINGSWVGPQRVNAFYYEEFERGNTDWSELSSEHNFRIRYTPRVLGLYKCRIVSKVAGYSETQSEYFNFVCEPSNSKGFMRVGDNKRYFKVEDEPFFPVGQNLTGPNNAGLTWEWSQQTCLPEHYVSFQNLMTQLSENGGNYFRYIVSPWQTEIEFEHLGNYSNRQSNAWEFDRILDTAKALDLKIHWDMQMHYAFEAPNGFAMTQWDWSSKEDASDQSFCYSETDSGYCYRKELGISNPVDFLTDELAKKHYKNRLRYMVARWGYSPQIAVMELLSEAGHVGEVAVLDYVYTYTVDPLTGDSTISGGKCVTDLNSTDIYKPRFEIPIEFYSKLVPWQTEMLTYIKNDLGHSDHPTAVSSTGEPDFDNGDSIFQSNSVDIATWNYYQHSIERNEKNYDRINNKNSNPGSYHVSTFDDTGLANDRYIDKPLMHSEYGFSAGLSACDKNLDFIKGIYLSPFIGLAGSAMSWNKHLNEEGVWEYIGIMREFMEGVKLDEENWRVGEPIITDDKMVEVYYMKTPVSEGGEHNSKAIGIISNRTFNYFTIADTLPCANTDVLELENNPQYMAPINLSYSDLISDIKIPSMAYTYLGQYLSDYQVVWISALTGETIDTSYVTIDGGTSTLELEFPLILTGTQDLPLVLFEAYPVNSTIKSSSTVNVNSPKKEEELNGENLSILTYPNPVSDNLQVELGNLKSNYEVFITDVKGNVINSLKGVDSRFEVNFNTIERGIYYLTVISENTILTEKIIRL
ncbi:MAG: T9SS type A sorting domain-containing protein [Crocinitomicaceae bacterium]